MRPERSRKSKLYLHKSQFCSSVWLGLFAINIFSKVVNDEKLGWVPFNMHREWKFLLKFFVLWPKRIVKMVAHSSSRSLKNPLFISDIWQSRPTWAFLDKSSANNVKYMKRSQKIIDISHISQTKEFHKDDNTVPCTFNVERLQKRFLWCIYHINTQHQLHWQV